MSLLEWIGESYDPGELGTVHVGRGKPPRRSAAAIIFRFIIAVGLLLAVGLGLYFGIPGMSWLTWLIFAGVSLFYLLLGYFLRPEPHLENLGWLGGAIDHPWRYSDDLNRFALFMLILLYPGRFIAESIIDMLRLLLGKAPPPRRGPKQLERVPEDW